MNFMLSFAEPKILMYSTGHDQMKGKKKPLNFKKNTLAKTKLY